MFLSSYDCFGSVAVCEVLQTATLFNKEQKIYEFITKLATKQNWKAVRVDTVGQIGFPDMLLLKSDCYWQIEAKQLKKSKLLSLEDDISWEFGQFAYMKRALSLNLNYILAVSKGNKLAIIKGDYCEQRECFNYSDLVR